jgi:hypothetical protein
MARLAVILPGDSRAALHTSYRRLVRLGSMSLPRTTPVAGFTKWVCLHRSADNGLISVGIYIVCGKALNAKARVQAVVHKSRHSIMISEARRVALI